MASKERMKATLVLADGTVFHGGHLSTKSEFGHSHRTKSGILEEI